MFTNTEGNLIIEMYFNKKLSANKIAKIFSCSKTKIILFIKNSGHKMRNRDEVDQLQIDKERDKKIEEMYVKEKTSSNKIAKILEISERAVLNALRRRNVNIRTIKETRKKFTDKEGEDLDREKEIVRLYVEEKHSSIYIAKIMDVSSSHVLMVVDRNGYKKRNVSEAKIGKNTGDRIILPIEEIIHLYINKRKTSTEIAKIFNCSYTVIIERLRENNIKIRNAGNLYHIHPKMEEIKELYLNGYLMEWISAKLDIPATTVFNVIKKIGLSKHDENYIMEKRIESYRKNHDSGKHDNRYLKLFNMTYNEYLISLPEFKRYRKIIERVTRAQKTKTLKNIEKRGKAGKESAYHLDHKYSILEGFKNNIPPEIVGNIVNLEMIPWEENLKKQGKCSLLLEELLSLYEQNLKNEQ